MISKSKILIGVMLASTMVYASSNTVKTAPIGTMESSNHITVAQKKQPVEYVYSSSKIQYANIATIERLKKAVVILIGKVNQFEKELNAKEIKRKDLDALATKISLTTSQTIDKTLVDLRQAISQNSRKIADIKYGNSSKKNNINEIKTSKYDKKIMDFIKKESQK